MTSTRTSRLATAATASLLLLAVALASGCKESNQTIVETTTAVPDVLVGEWRVDSFTTVGALRPVPDNVVATVRFQGGSGVEIETGCGKGSAIAAFATDSTFGTTLELSGLTTARSGVCDELATSIERDLLELLGHPLSWDVRDGQLKLLPTDVTDSGLILRTAALGTDGTTDTDAALVAAAANHRVRMANGSGTPNALSSVAILDTFGIPDADGLLGPAPGAVSVPDDVRRAIELELGPITVRWVATASDVATEPSATWDEQPPTALLTLSEPVLDGATATVISDLRCGPGCLIGGGQAFERDGDGSWVAVSQIGAQWQS